MTRIHRACGRPMSVNVFGSHDPSPVYRGQRIWSCANCAAWEPHEDWQGAAPAGWDGQAWVGEGR